MKPWQKILYSAGSLGTALSYQAFGTYIQFLYIDVLGLKAALVGTGWAIYGVWNAVNDPLTGYISDHTRTRWGRRIPYIATLTFPLALLFYLLWVPPSPIVQGGQTPLFVYFMVAVLFFDLLWTWVVMCWTALFPEMFSEQKERATVSGWRQMFSVIGLLIGVALPPMLAGEGWSQRGQMAALFAVITAVSFFLSLAGSRERVGRPDEPQPPFWQALRVTMNNVGFRYFLVANLFKEFTYSVMTATIPFYAKYVLNIQSPLTLAGGLVLDVGLQNSLLLGLAFIAALPALGIWTAYARRVGGRRAWMTACITFGVTFVLFLWAYDFYTGVLATVILGLSLAGLLVMPDLLVADVVDEDETVTGVRREGMFFGMNGFVIRFAFTLQGALLGTVLTVTGYVPPTEGVWYPAQPIWALWGLRFMMGIVPMIAAAITFWALSRYPLHGPRLEEVRRQVEALHAARARDRG